MTGSAFLSHLDISLPIIQAPMAGISTPPLAASVSNAGALGSLGIAAMTPEQADKVIRETSRLTTGPFNVNVFCHAPARRDPKREAEWLHYLSPYFHEFGVEPPNHLQLLYKSFQEDNQMLSVLLDLKPAVVSFHFGLPSFEQIRALKEAGICLLATATNLDEARQISAAQMDGIIAQGIEAGGHRGTFDPDSKDEGLGTIVLTRLIVQKLSLPVISAGGIMDGAGIVAALALGASAAQLGTAFVTCPESAADLAYREVLLSQPSLQTAMTSAISGRPARGVVNRFTVLGESPSCPGMPDYPLPYFAGKALNTAAKQQGDSSFAAHWTGQGISMIRSMPAEKLVKLLSEEIDQATKVSPLEE
jgi:nitronate monooxygenase